MLSLKALMDQSGTEMSGTLRRSVLVLLEGIALNAFPYNAEELLAFQRKIGDLRADFDRSNTPDTVLELTGQAIRKIEEFGVAAEGFVSKEKRQTKETIGLLMNSLVEISKGSTESVRNLQRIGTDLEKVRDSSDIASINERLRACLDILTSETERQIQLQSGIQAQIEQVVKIEAAAADMDAATGLPGTLSAKGAVRAAAGRSATSHVFAFRVERLEAINARFGFQAGDEILLLFAQHIAQRLPPEDTLFRWRGPCFVAITDREVPESMLAAEASRILATKLSHTITSGGREIVMQVTASWTMLGLPPKSSPEDAIRKLDEFANQRAHVLGDAKPRTSAGG